MRVGECEAFHLAMTCVLRSRARSGEDREVRTEETVVLMGHGSATKESRSRTGDRRSLSLRKWWSERFRASG